jgi:GNAT superfamily N-acetyltransferase
MKLRICWTHRLDIIGEMHRKIFTTDELPKLHNTIHWLVFDNKKPIGFAILRELEGVNKGCFFLSRAGVLKAYRKQGLHRRLIRVRERYVARVGGGTILTYVALDNPASFCNLIRCGYRVYEPEYKYVGSDFLYFQKTIKP